MTMRFAVTRPTPARPRQPVSSATQTTLYVILSHPPRTAMLMLEHKGIPYRRVELPAGLQAVALRLLGFPGNKAPFRRIDGRLHPLPTTLDAGNHYDWRAAPAVNDVHERSNTGSLCLMFREFSVRSRTVCSVSSATASPF